MQKIRLKYGTKQKTVKTMRPNKNLMKKILLILCCVFSLIQSNAQNNQPWTLKRAIEHALENNIQIKQSYYDMLGAEIEKKDALGQFLPSVNLSSSHSWNIGLNQNITTGLLEDVTTQFTNMSVNVGLDLYNGKKKVYQLLRSNLNILASQYQLANMQDDISLLVANSYLQLLFSRENFRIQQQQIQITTEEVSQTKELVLAGVLPEGDLFEVEANLAAQEQQFVQSENAYRIATIALAQLLLVTDYANFKIAEEDFLIGKEDILNKSPDELYQVAVINRNDIQLAITNIEISEANLALSKAATKPRISAFYGYNSRISYADRLVGTGEFSVNPIGYVGSSNELVYSVFEQRKVVAPLSIEDQFKMNDGHNFGLNLSVPILNGFSAKNNVKRSQLNIERSKSLLEQEKLNLENTINQSYNDARGALKAYHAALKTLESRQKAYLYAQNRFQVGASTAFEFTQVKLRLEAAESELLRSKYDYIFKLKVLEFYFGLPIDLD